MPTAPISRPPDQQSAATTPALRGPARSSQPPQTAAATPRKTMNRVNTQFRSATSQSQLVVNRAFRMPEPAGQATGLPPPISARQRQPEHAEAVGHADAEMDRQRGRRHQPAIDSPASATIRFRSNKPGTAVAAAEAGVRGAHGSLSRTQSFLIVRRSAPFSQAGRAASAESFSTACRTGGSSSTLPVGQLRDDRPAHPRVPELQHDGPRSRRQPSPASATGRNGRSGWPCRPACHATWRAIRRLILIQMGEDFETVGSGNADQCDAGGVGDVDRERGRRGDGDDHRRAQRRRLLHHFDRDAAGQQQQAVRRRRAGAQPGRRRACPARCGGRHPRAARPVRVPGSRRRRRGRRGWRRSASAPPAWRASRPGSSPG